MCSECNKWSFAQPLMHPKAELQLSSHTFQCLQHSSTGWPNEEVTFSGSLVGCLLVRQVSSVSTEASAPLVDSRSPQRGVKNWA